MIPDLILIGCTKLKRESRATAATLYDPSPLFRRRRAWARRRSDEYGIPWGILSARHGVMPPSALIHPYEQRLSDLDREGWQRWCDRTLIWTRELLGRGVCGVVPPLPETTVIEVHAGRPYVDALREAVEGGTITHPVQGLQIGEQLRWYSQCLQEPDHIHESALGQQRLI